MTEPLIYTAILAAYEAGQAILEIYSQDFAIEYKPDQSPITLADKKAHRIISGHLEKSGIPVLSEEGSEIPFEVRKDWKSFWLVDPLDGTKEFINRNGDFTVNIALILDTVPVAGVIYAPVPDMVYFALPVHGSFRIKGDLLVEHSRENLDELIRFCTPLPAVRNEDGFVIVASRSHQNRETSEFIESMQSSRNNVTFLSKGSSLKFCAVAEGSADLYPRLGPTMEWDTAAGHAIAMHAGCTVFNAITLAPLVYNKESLLNPSFLVERK